MKLVTSERQVVATGVKTALTVDVITGHEDFLALEAEWSALLQSSRSNLVFLTHEWFRAWWDAFGRGSRLFVVCVRNHGRLVGIAPLHLRRSTFRGLPVHKLSFMSNGYTAESDFIVAPPEEPVYRAIFAHLAHQRNRWDLLELKNMRADSPLWTHLPSAARDCGLFWLKRSDKQVPFITIDGSWESYLAERSRNFRKSLRRRFRSIRKHPEPVCVFKLSSPDALAAALPGMLQVSESSWKRQHKWDISSDPAAVRFFERLSEVLGRRGWVELWLATCGDRPIAFEFHLRYGNVTSPIRGDFDESYRSLSPGAYLETEIIRRLFDDTERTCVEYNTCADAYPYECRWTAHIRPHDTAWIFAPSWYRAVLYPLALLRRPRKAVRSDRALSCRPAGSAGAARKSTGARDATSRQPDRPGKEAEKKKDRKRSESQSLVSRAKTVAKAAYAVAHDIPLAIRDEKNYYISKRKDALLILTWGCTSKCTACTVWRRPRHAEKELTLDEWIGVARKLVSRGIRVVELFGGDIFVRKDIVPPLAKELKSLGCKVHMPTNSNLMDQETANALVDSLDVVYLSTDGTGELHDEVRGVKGTFGRLTNALDCFLAARGDKPTPYIVCNTTVSRFNYHALTDIASFAARAGYDEIRFEYVGQFNDDIISRSRIGDFTPSPIFVQEGPSCLLEEEHVSLFREQLRLARRHTPRTASTGRPFTVVTLNADVLSDKDLVAGTIPGSRCFPERNSVVIDPYGNIVPCMFYDKYSTGNVREGALDRSLETPERKRFRELRDNGKLDMCKHCILKVARNHEAVDTLKRAYLESVHAHEPVLPPLKVAKSPTNGRATNGARHISLPVLAEPARGCSGP